jgi:hypothetical protein
VVTEFSKMFSGRQLCQVRKFSISGTDSAPINNTLKMETKSVPEMLKNFHTLMWLSAQEHLIEYLQLPCNSNHLCPDLTWLANVRNVLGRYLITPCLKHSGNDGINKA